MLRNLSNNVIGLKYTNQIKCCNANDIFFERFFTFCLG